MLVIGVIYRTEITTYNEAYTYAGLTNRPFKDRYYKHRRTFNDQNPEDSTTLSRKVLGLRNTGEEFNIQWSIIDRDKPYNPKTRKCSLCTKEKFHMILMGLA